MSKTLRPAEDIAREMVPDPIMRDDHGRILAEMRYPGSTVGSVWPDFARPEEVDDLRRLLARLIEQTRAEVEAAILAGQASARKR